ncbi:MAG: hypothetical protein FD177_51 [Desulfovibrionaceae bacterium]|nr:MAG: hypothetical protein FD177_51 [Desulfovibrionaceae bacterium]
MNNTGKKSLLSSPEPSRYTLMRAINENPWADWHYWRGLPTWTPEEASWLFLHKDPHLATDDDRKSRAYQQADLALKRFGHVSDMRPHEWATIFSSLPPFEGVSQAINKCHPFSYMVGQEPSEYLVQSNKIASLEDQLDKARRENTRLTQVVERMEKIEADGPLDSRKRNTYLRIIAAALCKDGVRDPLSERGLAGRMTKRAQRIGLEFNEQTARNVIREVLGLLNES